MRDETDEQPPLWQRCLDAMAEAGHGGKAVWPLCEPAMKARAYALAQDGAYQDAIMLALAREFPGLPGEAYYANTAAEGAMQAVRAEQIEAQRKAADLKRLAEKGLPAALADRNGPAIRPAWCTCAEDAAWRGPTDQEAASVPTAGELVELCARYDLHMRVDELGLVLSRKIDPRCGLVEALRAHKPEILTIVRARQAATAGAMSAGVRAFAEARGLRCAYCGRTGTRTGDPDGRAWARDAVPTGLQVAARPLELACSACKDDPDRFTKLGTAEDDGI